MFSRHITVLVLSAGFIVQNVEGTRNKRSMYYHGPPAPLNHDGTVASTPEVQNAAAAQKAAFDAKYKRLQEAERLAAAHPDFTSPSYNKGNQGQQSYVQYNQEKSNNYPQVYIPAPLNQDGTVALTTEVQQAKAAHLAAITAEYQRYQEAARLAAAHPDLTSPRGHYSQNQHSAIPQHSQQLSNQHNQQPSYTYNPEARIPAPLNHDGTVAYTAEYKAVAAAHQAEYARAVQNTKYQNSLTQYKDGASSNNNYW
ncbi:pupal cuticle protein-like [Halyomorpha halys]|uniref:pupal cuticle protein-like n=1 Tax=Halyomorpha halys TaxID=286706 RepID=UPI0006D52136|nr:pupal cuticle protein-like [Halyomorpha halys]